MRFVFLFLMICGAATAQSSKGQYKGLPSLVWPKLYNVKYEKKYDERGAYDKPVFSNEAMDLSGKTVTLPGYMVPFQNGTRSAHFMLSSLPLNACFFCGVGGPETAVEVFLKQPVKYTEKPVEIRGTLLLNDRSADQLIYILENAEFLGEIDL